MHTYTCFNGINRLESGSLQAVGLAVKRAVDRRAASPVLIFNDLTGKSVDINTCGSDEEVLARLEAIEAAAQYTFGEQQNGSSLPAAESAQDDVSPAEPRGRGRPKLGVVAREVTLLPRHWDWLATQPGGASVALRKLVEHARKTHADKDKLRLAQERAYNFMSAMAGDFPGFEEAIRALFANDQSKFAEMIRDWPVDVREHASWLAYGDLSASP